MHAGAAKESGLKLWTMSPELTVCLGQWVGRGLCLGELWGFVLPPQLSSPSKLIALMQLNSCFFTGDFTVNTASPFPRNRLGIAVRQRQQCW